MVRRSSELIVIHCSATRPSMDVGRDEIDAWHRHRGFFGIGYHYVIRRDGSIEPGRDEDKAGAHARGFNHKSLAVALVGGVTEDDITIAENNFTEEQFVSLGQLVKGLQHKYPEAKVVGHNELEGVIKECPSFDVQEWLSRQV